VASEDADSEDLTEGTHEPRECMACRGTGRVISNLGGTTSTVSCPWCGGGGLRAVDIDAQSHWGTGEDEQPGESAEASAQAAPVEEGSAE
jgi:DnaJ-class molecular chaperone